MEPIQFVTPNRDSKRLFNIAANIVFLAFMSNLASADPAIPEVKVQAQSDYGKLPLSFEANQGQTDAQVKFLARGQGYVLFLTPTEAVLSLKKSQTQARDSSLAKFSPSSFIKSSSLPKEIRTILRIQFIGAHPTLPVLGEQTLPGLVNYLIGNDPNQWLTGIPTYAKVTYEGLYPGVNLVYYGNQGQLEYDFIVAPGADPGRIKLAFKGANKIEVSPTGELVLHTASGKLRMHKPVIYQETGGTRKSIPGGYVLTDDQTVSFQVAAFDSTRPLIIDPVLVYSTYLGGSKDDAGIGIAVDQFGQAYVTGQTGSSDFPSQNAQDSTLGGNADAFVAQLTADGMALRYSTYLGGSGLESGNGIAVDKKGQAYVTGFTTSADFPTENALQHTFGGFVDAFVAQLTADGAALRYSTYLGGNLDDRGQGIAIDQLGRASVTGSTESVGFPTYNALQPMYGGGVDAFVARFKADGSGLLYSTYLGGSRFDEGFSIAVDQRGQAYVTGQTGSADFPTENALQHTFGGVFDAFVAQFTVDGTTLRYATYLGGSSFDEGFGIAVDQRGQAYVTGFTTSADFPTENALQPVLGNIADAGIEDAFVTQLTTNGVALRYSTYLGGNGDDRGRSIAVDQRGQAYVTGRTRSADFPTMSALQPALSGPEDAFVTQLTVDGMALRYSTYLGGSGLEFSNGIAVDKKGHAYVTGFTTSTNFPTENALQPVLDGGDSDAFVTKIASDDR